MRIHLDFETQSIVDIQKQGGVVYATHPSTKMLCAAWCEDDGPIHLVTTPSELDTALKDYANNPSVEFAAHNAGFEISILQMLYDRMLISFPPPSDDRWICTAAKAAWYSLPRKLEGVGKAMQLPLEKDMEGNKVMQMLCKPKRATKANSDMFWTPETNPGAYEKLYKYCVRDVEVERMVDSLLPDLTERERKVWVFDRKVNSRGVHVDLALVRRILEYRELTKEDLERQCYLMTGVPKPSQHVALREWVNAAIGDQFEPLEDMQKQTLAVRIADKTLPENVIPILALREEHSKSSTSKLEAMERRVSADGRIRDMFLYCAAITKRWGGRGVQPQNLPRGVYKSDYAIRHLLNFDYDTFRMLYGKPMAVYSSCIRGCFVAGSGKDFIVADLNAIEARVVAWVAGERNVLEAFIQGRDVYCEEASTIFNRNVTKADGYERLVGKVSILALGYNGGINAFGTMCRAYSVDLAPAFESLWSTVSGDERTKAGLAYKMYRAKVEKGGIKFPLPENEALVADIIKQRWRKKNATITNLWRECERAAIDAVLDKRPVTIGGFDGRPAITFYMNGSFLMVKLPSGTEIVYPFPKVSTQETEFGHKQALSYRDVDDTTFQFIRKFTYGGKLVENIVQCLSRDILVDGMLRAEHAGYPIVLHVHDEAVAEVDEGLGDVQAFETMLATTPEWANGLPLKAEGWRGKRYRK